MKSHHLKKINLRISGMTCHSCEILIERQLKKIPGVAKVAVSQSAGKAELLCFNSPELSQLQDAVKSHGYQISQWNGQNSDPSSENRRRHFLEIGVIFVILLAAYMILKQFNLVPASLGISDNMSYGFVFLIGLVAAFSSCIAVTGGLLLAVAAKYNELNPAATPWQKFKPHLYFNLGRIISYTVMGGVIGGLGSALAISPRTSGIMTIIASTVMILLGVQLLHIFPWLNRLSPKMPKFLAHRIHDQAGSPKRSAPLLLGGATFFLPCGFTMALQLYVLSKGEVLSGALTMLAFSLGTLPALLSLSALSSFLKGSFQRYFLKFSGVLVLIIGFNNFGNGWNLTGNPFASSAAKSKAEIINEITAPSGDISQPEIVDGIQIARMKVEGLEYTPYRFLVKQNVPVEWQIDGAQALGCAKVIVSQKLGLTEYLPTQGIKKIRFTPTQVGEIPFSCSMGMTTPGAAFVVEANPGSKAAETGNIPSSNILASEVETASSSSTCDPRYANCIGVQKLAMTISRESGFNPNYFEIKQNQPVELTINTKTPMSGCMSTLVIPEYNLAHRLAMGKSVLRFTPTRIGEIPFTCGMGIELGTFKVTE